jgi:hypothetical protein
MVRITAGIVWEDCDREAFDLYFEVPESFGDSLAGNPDPFVVASLVPAMHYGERRIAIEGEVCPELREGLTNVMGWLRHWFYDDTHPPVRVEAAARDTALPGPARAGFFFSGGVDSFTTLRLNHLGYPSRHPGRFKDGIVVYGLEMDEPQAYDHVVSLLSETAEQIGIDLVPVRTNAYLPYRSEDAVQGFNFWYREFMGAALAAAGHALSGRLNSVTISSDYDIPNQRPHGSHPLIDPNYSSNELKVRHQGFTLSRYEKSKVIADWELALRHLRVCNQFRQYEPGKLNCGRCEKCVRTMLALTALGVLERTDAFPVAELTPDLVNSVVKLTPATYPLYHELLAPLRERGHRELARAVESRLLAYRRGKFGLKRLAKRFDRKYLGGRLRKLSRTSGRKV